MKNDKPIKIFTILSILLPLMLFAEDWPRFRGPTGQGISEEKNLPVSWSATEGILWNKEVFRQVPGHKEMRNSYATPTPVTDGKLVFAAFNDGSIAAVTTEGKLVWQNRDYQFYSQHGLGVSPVLFENLFIIPFDGSSRLPDKHVGWQEPWEKAFILALDKNNGKELWKGKRGLSRIAHATPIVIRYQGKPQLISCAGDVVQGFEPQTGKRIWTVKSSGEGVVPSPVSGENLVFSVLAKNEIGEGCKASYAISNGKIIIRAEKHLYCIVRE